MLEKYDDNDVVVREVHDTTLHKVLYSFSLDCIDLGKFGNEIRLCTIEHNK